MLQKAWDWAILSFFSAVYSLAVVMLRQRRYFGAVKEVHG